MSATTLSYFIKVDYKVSAPWDSINCIVQTPIAIGSCDMQQTHSNINKDHWFTRIYWPICQRNYVTTYWYPPGRQFNSENAHIHTVLFWSERTSTLWSQACVHAFLHIISLPWAVDIAHVIILSLSHLWEKNQLSLNSTLCCLLVRTPKHTKSCTVKAFEHSCIHMDPHTYIHTYMHAVHTYLVNVWHWKVRTFDARSTASCITYNILV